jgi:hypothetical protein
LNSAERIGRLIRLTPPERRRLLRAWWYLLVVDIALRCLPVTWLLPRPPVVASRTPPLPLERMAWLLEVARRHSPVCSTCLTEALVFARMLRADGVEATVKFGVARHHDRLHAHAWVEHRGEVVYGSPEPYAPLQECVIEERPGFAGARRARGGVGGHIGAPHHKEQ